MFERLFGKTNKQIVLEKAKFNLWQDVWTMNNNRPVKVRIVSIRTDGAYDQLKQKVFSFAVYKVTESDYYSAAHGVDIQESKIYATKQELIDSITQK
mgnify:CR=1 FL=1|tara:strand:- start:218 stop:508 length:291 start_codon:yes stop_codon:yes gene_type:complete